MREREEERDNKKWVISIMGSLIGGNWNAGTSDAPRKTNPIKNVNSGELQASKTWAPPSLQER